MILLFLIFPFIYSLPITSSCYDQLRTFYISLGMPVLTPSENPFNFTQGTLLGVNFVTIGINVQTAASNYASSFGHVPAPNNSFVSIDLPYCQTNITYTCMERVIYGITKTSNCSLKDRDVAFGSPISGRLFLYPSHDPPCFGSATITIFNVTLTPNTNSSNYTYDIEGINSGVLKSETAAISSYRSAICPYSDGNSTDVPIPLTQFSCLDQTLQCNSPRPVDDTIITTVNVTVRFKCITSGTINNFVQVINHDREVDGIESEFDLHFISTITGLDLGTVYDRQLIKPNRVRQYTVGSAFINYNFSMASAGYNFTNTAISMPPVPQRYLQRIPCICNNNFSIICDDNGIIDTSTEGSFYYLDNIYPVALANTSTPFLRIGSTAFLNDAGSFDPDNSPDNISIYWIQGFGIDDINITVINPTSLVNASFVTFPYTKGTYTMVELVSDGQDLNFTEVNVTAVDIFPTCEAQPQIFGEINTTIYLNASLSSDPLNATLDAFWIQLTNFPVVIHNNDTLVADFNTTFSGTYIFQVNLTNGLENCTYQQIVIVNPATFAPLPDNGTMAPFVNPDNRTLPPIDINQSDIPTLSNPPFVNPDPNGTTLGPTPVPAPLFPPVPDPQTTFEKFLFWILFGIFIGISLLFFAWSLIEQDDRILIIKNPYIVSKK